MKRTLFAMLLLGLILGSAYAVPRNLVVVEIGTGTWCPYCPGAAMGADDLVANNHPVGIIENHNGDTYANTYSNARNTYYNITGYPTAVFDGLNPYVGGSNTQSLYNQYLSRVNARMAVAAKYTISAVGTISGNNINIYATVNKPEDDTNTNVVLHCAFTESEIQQNWQGQTHLNFVNRLMSPNQNGTPVNLATGEQITIPLTATWNTAWNMSHGEVVLFLQNTSTKEVLQGVKYSLPGLLGATPISVTALNFNPISVGGTATLPFSISNYYDTPVTGTFSINNPVFTMPSSNFTIPAFQSQVFNVSFNPTAVQDYTGTLNITSNLQGYNVVDIPLTGSAFANAAPVAQNVTIFGPPVIHQDLGGSYVFVDPDGNAEGNTSVQWMRIVNNNPVPIDGANSATYRIQELDLGFALAFQVTPRDIHGLAGTPVMSEYTLPIENLPAPQNLAGILSPPDTVTLTWERPEHFGGRGFVGYRVFRDELPVQTITNVNTLTFTDTYVPEGVHQYWVCSLFNNPMLLSEPSNVVTISVGVSNSDELAPAIEKVSVYPNPFSAITNIEIQTKASQSVRLDIYNLKGQLVKSLDGLADQYGKTLINWNGTDNDGSQVQNGIYFYRTRGAKVLTGKIVVNK